MSAEQKLAQIRAILDGVDTVSAVKVPLKAYDTPELSVDDVICDGKTFNRDGSVWATSKGANGPPGTKFQVIYGYISPLKNPELWKKIKDTLGSNFDAWDKARDPWAIYKVDLRALFFSGQANALNVSWLLSTDSRYEQ